MQRLEEGKHDSQTMLSGGRKTSGELAPGVGVAVGMGTVSALGAVATATFITGLVLFLVAFASTDWLGIEQGLALSLWRTCSRSYVDGEWRCEPWERIPGEFGVGEEDVGVGVCVFEEGVCVCVWRWGL